MTAGQAPHNDPSRALVCSADASGQVLVHALEADGSWQNCCAFDVTTYDETPSLCTSTRMRGVYLYCAYSTGHVRIFDLVSCSQLVQISAHARWIHALEVHPNGALFATASEDTTIALWDFHEGPKVRELPWLTRVTYRLATSHLGLPSLPNHEPCLSQISLSRRVYPQVRHLGSITVSDALLCGLSFCGGVDRSHVCGVAYDQGAIHSWKLD